MYFTEQADVGLVLYKNTCENNYFSTPNKIFEYLHAGLPMVSSDHPGKRYIVEDASIGVCVPETPESIASGIQVVIKRRSEFKTNIEQAKKQYLWDHEVKKLIALYDGV